MAHFDGFIKYFKKTEELLHSDDIIKKNYKKSIYKSFIDDKHYEEVHVENDNGMIYLWVQNHGEGNDNTYQSIFDLKDIEMIYINYMYFMLEPLNYITEINNCLIIGLGAGQLSMILKKIIPNLNMDIVELNPIMYDIVRSFDTHIIDTLNNKKNINYHIQNGITFLQKYNELYDLISIDLDGIQAYENFDFHLISDILTKNGIFVSNVYSDSGLDVIKDTTITKLLNENFKYVKKYIIYSGKPFDKPSKNYVFICMNKYEPDLFNTVVKNKLGEYKYINKLIEIWHSQQIDDVVFEIEKIIN